MTVARGINEAMTPSEQAWIAREYLMGRTQRNIAEELELTSSVISSNIAVFCTEWGGVDVKAECIYEEARKAVLRRAMDCYLGEHAGQLEKPRAYDPTSKINRPEYAWSVLWEYERARHEHAWLLRAEGVTYSEIGQRLGVGRERAQQLVHRQGRRVQRAIRNMRGLRIRYENDDRHDGWYAGA